MILKYKINKNLLFVGDLNTYTRTYQRYNILRKIFDTTFYISTEDEYIPGINKNNKSFLYRVFFKIGFQFDIKGINEKILSIVEKNKIDIIWIEKVNYLKLSVLKKIKDNRILIFYTNDNINKLHNISLNYLLFIKYFDYLLIPEDYHNRYYKNKIKVFKFNRSFDDNFISKVPYNPNKILDVVFIGSYEYQRFQTLNYVAKRLNTQIHIFGNNWNKAKRANNNLIIHNKPLYENDLIIKLRDTKIALNFLRKKNDDQTTGRTFEILATNTFMLSENSNLHSKLFINDLDCVFFDNNEDLITKIKFYLINEKKRISIANNGCNKVHSLYTYQIWINKFLTDVYQS